MVADPASAYRKTRLTTSSPGNLLVMLFDGGIKHATRAKECIIRGEKETAHTYLVKAQEIVLELIASLDTSVELATPLFQLYEYVHHRLVEANVRKDAGAVDDALVILKGLRDTWEEALKEAGADATASEIRRRPTYAGVGGIELAH